MNHFVRIRDIYYNNYFVNVNQISYILELSPNKYNLFFGETAMTITVDATEVQKIFR